MNMVFDTGSGWLTVPTSACDSCANKNYDVSDSSTSIEVTDEEQKIEVRSLDHCVVWVCISHGIAVHRSSLSELRKKCSHDFRITTALTILNSLALQLRRVFLETLQMEF